VHNAKGVIILVRLVGLKHQFKNQTLQAVLLLTLELIIFFSSPLLNIADHYYSASDLTQIYSLTKVTSGHVVGQVIFGDPVIAFQPWLIFNRDSFWSGQIPLWNPNNASGAPQLGNFQSAVFSIYSLPFYLLTFRQALLVSAFMKLFGLGFFTFLYLKKLGIRQGPALIGATAFMFSGYQVVWLAWPMTAAAIVLPAGLYFAECVFSRFQPNQVPTSTHHFWPLVGLSLTLTVGLLAGHPETFYFTFLLLAIYILFRLINLYGSGLFKASLRRHSFTQLIRLGAEFTLSGLIAIGLCALQLLPFLEYLLNSSALYVRSNVESDPSKSVLFAKTWPLSFIPDLFGNGTNKYNAVNTTIPISNYNEINGVFIGGLIVFLAICSLTYIYRDKYIRFFAIASFFWLIYAYNLFNLDSLFGLIPGIKIIPIGRSQEIWLFSLSCCAALFLNHFLKLEPSRRWHRLIPVLSFGLGGSAFLLFGLLGAKGLVEEYYKYILPQAKDFLAYVPGQVWSYGLTFGLGLLATLGLILLQDKRAKATLVGVVLVTVFLQSGYLLKDYNPLTEDRFFYPVTPAVKQIQQTVGDKTLVIYGGDTILPNTNLVYKLRLISSLDALWVKDYDQLLKKMYGGIGGLRLTTNINETGLKLFGVDYVIGPKQFIEPDSKLINAQSQSKENYPVGEIVAQQEVTQTFKASQNGLQSITIFLATYARSNICQLNLRLEEVISGKIVANQTSRCQKVKNNEGFNFSFEMLPDSANKQYRLVLSSSDASPGQAVTALARPDLIYPDGTLHKGGQTLQGNLIFTPIYNKSSFLEPVADLGTLEPVAGVDTFNLYRYKNSLSKFYTVNQAIITQSDKEALDRIIASDFDPYQTVILSQDKDPITPPTEITSQVQATPVQAISEKPDAIRLKLTRSEPGYLVLNLTNYPGWKAKVNGLEKPVLRANYAFNAIEIGRGESEVEFYYDPDSFKFGLIISLVSLLFGLILIGWKILKG
jgi:hypothetical protein